MLSTVRRASLMALGISIPAAIAVLAAHESGSDAAAHAAGFATLVLGLPWVVPAFVAVSVLSAPLYVALHILGQPQDLMPWLSAVILIAGIVACHVNTTLLLQRLLRKPVRAPDGGLAEFLFRQSARAG
jgi:hypothetical protein